MPITVIYHGMSLTVLYLIGSQINWIFCSVELIFKISIVFSSGVPIIGNID
jgi:hypothetical protein